jgi:ABC-type transporter Mla subunit MlaD
MRRIAAIVISALALAAVLATSAPGEGGPSGNYLVRAYFGNAGFLVAGEEVRIAGATVGTVDEVDVSRVGEPVMATGADDPGKAVVVLKIADDGFKDFRSDASCIIRPQSLLGEKFVECEPTQPRSSLSEAPPELETIPDGEVGEGERFLPIESNGKAVDLDLVTNIIREPEADRLRLILNDLGAGLAARGDTLGEVIERANPALKQTDEVLAILAEQSKGLAQIATDSDAILQPLSRERDRIAGFIQGATTTSEAVAERRDDLEQTLIELPPALRELEPTMVELRRFAEEAQPVAADLNIAAPSLTGTTRALKPLANAGTPALIGLGDAAEESGPDFAASAPLVRDVGKLAEANKPAAKNLNALLKSLRKSGGTELLYSALLNIGNSVNGFDDFGHFQRSAIQINNCVDVSGVPLVNCSSNWAGASSSAAQAAAAAAQPDSPEDTVGAPGSEPDGEAGSSKGRGRSKGKARDDQQRAATDLLEFLTEDGE